MPAAPPPVFFESQRILGLLAPPVFFGLLALVFVGSSAFLLWGLASESDDELTSDELRLLSGAPLSVQGASGGGGLAGRPRDEGSSSVFRVSSTPAGALVTINGEVEGVTPLWLENLPSQYHHVSLEMEGFGTADTLVYLDADVPTALAVTLSPAGSASPADSGVAAVPGPGPEQPDTAPPPSVPEPRTVPDARPPAPAPGSIRVRATPSDASVQLDGKSVGAGPLDLRDVPPGPHTVTVSRPGYESVAVHVDVEAGVREAVEVALIPLQGTLVVVVRPWGSIYVDGVLHARDTDVSFEAPLPVGRHEVRVEHPELGTRTRTVEVRPEQTTSAEFDLN